jgi:hypothetical protein
MRVAALLVVSLVLCSAPLAAQVVMQRSVAASGARVLQLETGGADIVLKPDARAASVRVVVTQSGAALPLPNVASARHGNRLVLSIAGSAGRPVIPFAAAASQSYALTYPARMRLDVRAASGNVNVIAPVAAVEIYDDDGNIVVANPRAPVTAENGSGNISVTAAHTDVDLAADSGSVRAELASGWVGGEVRIQSTAGSITLALPAGFRGRFDTSGSASVRNDFGASNARAPLVWLYAPQGSVHITHATR